MFDLNYDRYFKLKKQKQKSRYVGNAGGQQCVKCISYCYQGFVNVIYSKITKISDNLVISDSFKISYYKHF